MKIERLLNKIKKPFTRVEYVYKDPSDYGFAIKPGEQVFMDIATQVKDGQLCIANNGDKRIYICFEEKNEN